MQPTNFTPEKCLAYAFLSKMGDLKLQFLSQPWTPKEYKERFEQLADQLAENLSVWRNVDDELPADDCTDELLLSSDGYLYQGNFVAGESKKFFDLGDDYPFTLDIAEVDAWMIAPKPYQKQQPPSEVQNG